MNGCPHTGNAPLHAKKPAFPPAFICRHSSSTMKFVYIFSVRSTPVGTPVETITPSLTVNVFGAQFTFTHPDRSVPLNIGTNPSSSCPLACNAIQQIATTTVTERV